VDGTLFITGCAGLALGEWALDFGECGGRRRRKVRRGSLVLLRVAQETRKKKNTGFITGSTSAPTADGVNAPTRRSSRSFYNSQATSKKGKSDHHIEQPSPKFRFQTALDSTLSTFENTATIVSNDAGTSRQFCRTARLSTTKKAKKDAYYVFKCDVVRGMEALASVFVLIPGAPSPQGPNGYSSQLFLVEERFLSDLDKADLPARLRAAINGHTNVNTVQQQNIQNEMEAGRKQQHKEQNMHSKPSLLLDVAPVNEPQWTIPLSSYDGCRSNNRGNSSSSVQTWAVTDLTLALRRRFLHQDRALEVFFREGVSVFFDFEESSTRNRLLRALRQYCPSLPIDCPSVLFPAIAALIGDGKRSDMQAENKRHDSGCVEYLGTHWVASAQLGATSETASLSAADTLAALRRKRKLEAAEAAAIASATAPEEEAVEAAAAAAAAAALIDVDSDEDTESSPFSDFGFTSRKGIVARKQSIANTSESEGEDPSAVTSLWQDGLVSNFDYLMYLNTWSGRSFHDWTQYPVFPWVLADYTSEELDLTDPSVFRDLNKPMGACSAPRRLEAEARFMTLQEMYGQLDGGTPSGGLGDEDDVQFRTGLAGLTADQIRQNLVRLGKLTNKLTRRIPGASAVSGSMATENSSSRSPSSSTMTADEAAAPAVPLLPVLPTSTLERGSNAPAGEQDTDKPFHFGVHYSTATIVCHYLQRLQPFSAYAVALQGGRFDRPDRLFTSVFSGWNSASGGLNPADPSAATNSLQDVKELIPEFFHLPEIFRNVNGYQMGLVSEKSEGEGSESEEVDSNRAVNDVELPPWAKGSSREFVRLHRAALESPHVSMNLHNWIDLIFGNKSRGSEAVKACNVFHAVTYAENVGQFAPVRHGEPGGKEGGPGGESVQSEDESTTPEPTRRRSLSFGRSLSPAGSSNNKGFLNATKAQESSRLQEVVRQQIRDFGQTPIQLFQAPHPQRRGSYGPDCGRSDMVEVLKNTLSALDHTPSPETTENAREYGVRAAAVDSLAFIDSSITAELHPPGLPEDSNSHFGTGSLYDKVAHETSSLQLRRRSIQTDEDEEYARWYCQHTSFHRAGDVQIRMPQGIGTGSASSPERSLVASRVGVEGDCGGASQLTHVPSENVLNGSNFFPSVLHPDTLGERFGGPTLNTAPSGAVVTIVPAFCILLPRSYDRFGVDCFISAAPPVDCTAHATSGSLRLIARVALWEDNSQAPDTSARPKSSSGLRIFPVAGSGASAQNNAVPRRYSNAWVTLASSALPGGTPDCLALDNDCTYLAFSTRRASFTTAAECGIRRSVALATINVCPLSCANISALIMRSRSYSNVLRAGSSNPDESLSWLTAPEYTLVTDRHRGPHLAGLAVSRTAHVVVSVCSAGVCLLFDLGRSSATPDGGLEIFGGIFSRSSGERRSGRRAGTEEGFQVAIGSGGCGDIFVCTASGVASCDINGCTLFIWRPTSSAPAPPVHVRAITTMCPVPVQEWVVPKLLLVGYSDGVVSICGIYNKVNHTVPIDRSECLPGESAAIQVANFVAEDQVVLELQRLVVFPLGEAVVKLALLTRPSSPSSGGTGGNSATSTASNATTQSSELAARLMGSEQRTAGLPYLGDTGQIREIAAVADSGRVMWLSSGI
jgi:hypothetical protein